MMNPGTVIGHGLTKAFTQTGANGSEELLYDAAVTAAVTAGFPGMVSVAWYQVAPNVVSVTIIATK